MKQAPEVHESDKHGLFIVTEHGIFKYEGDCFKKVKICDQDGVEIQRIGTIHEPPGQNDDS